MKIALNMNLAEGQTAGQIEIEKLTAYLAAAQRGDWEAKRRIVTMFTPLVKSMAEHRELTGAPLAEAIDRGKRGVERAIKKFKTTSGGDQFQLFALKFIDAAIDSKGGLLGRLIGR
jgi:DNA-directed RNA polymerase sigma subunit (sigma70/sigma32)